MWTNDKYDVILRFASAILFQLKRMSAVESFMPKEYCLQEIHYPKSLEILIGFNLGFVNFSRSKSKLYNTYVQKNMKHLNWHVNLYY